MSKSQSHHQGHDRHCLPRGIFSRLLHRWNLQGLDLGFTLELGAGSGESLKALGAQGVGIESDPDLVARARGKGIKIFTPDEFWTGSEYAVEGRFDSLLLVRLAEHMQFGNLVKLLVRYAPVVRSGGKLVLISPQEKGFLSDASHVEFMDFARLERAAAVAGFKVAAKDSYPFPRNWGVSVELNDFVVTAIKK